MLGINGHGISDDILGGLTGDANKQTPQKIKIYNQNQ